MQEDFGQYVGKVESGLNGMLSLFKPLDAYEELEARWLIPDLIPMGGITLIASDGGVGKTSVGVDLAAAVSRGKPSFLEPADADRKPGNVLVLNSEESVRVVLKKRLRAADADEARIYTPDFANDPDGELQKVKFGTHELEAVISEIKPALCIFDPIQGFVPPGCVMGDRAAMRACMAPLVTLGEKYGTAFLIVCHTNKRKGAYGRDRISDSSDLWDIARSVLMLDWTEEEGVRYLSHEKCNYGPLQETTLFSIGKSGLIKSEGKTWKRDREYQLAEGKAVTKREDAKTWIAKTLEEESGRLPLKELATLAERSGISDKTLERAKTELAKQGKIRTYNEGYGQSKVWYIELCYFPN